MKTSIRISRLVRRIFLVRTDPSAILTWDWFYFGLCSTSNMEGGSEMGSNCDYIA